MKPPSEWLKLLCKDWAMENELLVQNTDAKYIDYKPYMKGLLSSQLLCRLSIPPTKESTTTTMDGSVVTSSSTSSGVDFWKIIGIDDEFDKAYIIAQVERFCAQYSIRAPSLEEHSSHPVASAAAAAATASNANDGFFGVGDLVHADPTALAAAAAQAGGGMVPLPPADVERAHMLAKDAERALESEQRRSENREHRRLSQERRVQKAKDREASAVRKASERAARETAREERRKKKLEIRTERERFAQEQKDAALQRAAELVTSNRVPLEITRGAAAARQAANAVLAAGGKLPDGNTKQKKRRSAIVVSTAGELHQIVTHAKALWAKYNAIAKEHNQRVNWITVAKELGIHVKVREKYSRMHSRAEQRGFDFVKYAHWKIKDHPEIFLEPTKSEQNAKIPPAPHHTTTTVLVDGGNKELVSAEAVSAAAAVVDASVVNASVDVTSPPAGAVRGEADSNTDDEQTAAAAATAAAVATLVADPTCTGLPEIDGGGGSMPEEEEEEPTVDAQV